MPRGDALGLHTDGRERWLHVHTWVGSRLTTERFSLGEDSARGVDRTVFVVDDSLFSEAERYLSQDGPNLHVQPIQLPGTLTVGAWHTPLPGARVTLLYAGPARVALDSETEVETIALVGEEGGRRSVQWLARGIGVFALGPLGAPPQRWMIGYAGKVPWEWPLQEGVEDLPRSGLPPQAEVNAGGKLL